jgi:hypothetical protein
MSDDWLQAPSVGDRYAAFRATLDLKTTAGAFGSRARDDDDELPPELMELKSKAKSQKPKVVAPAAPPAVTPLPTETPELKTQTPKLKTPASCATPDIWDLL